MIEKNDRIYISGDSGMVGTNLMWELRRQGYENLVKQSHKSLDLRNSKNTHDYLFAIKPDVIIMCAAKVGGIKVNRDNQFSFLYDNLMIQNNLISEAYNLKVKKLIFIGSSCIYPKLALNPLNERDVFKGEPEPTNEGYAYAKRAGIKLCEYMNREGENYISIIPCNLYGEFDNFDTESSHVIPSMIRKIRDAKVTDCKEVILWGDGTPEREFMYVGDLSKAILNVMNNYSEPEPINIGIGETISIMRLAMMIAKIIDYKGSLVFNMDKSLNGIEKKVLDSAKMRALNWKPEVSLEDGLIRTIDWYKSNWILRREVYP